MSDKNIKPSIQEKISNRKNFQLEGWQDKPLLLKLLDEAGFNSPYQSCEYNSKAYGGEFNLRNKAGETVNVVVTSFLGDFISVQFGGG